MVKKPRIISINLKYITSRITDGREVNSMLCLQTMVELVEVTPIPMPEVEEGLQASINKHKNVVLRVD